MLNLLSGSDAFAQAGDEFEGAVWRFSMTPNGQIDLSMETGTGGTLSAPGLRNRLPSVAKPGFRSNH